jgi:hypothetical protein
MKSNKRIPLSTEFAEFKLGRFAGSKSLALDWHRYQINFGDPNAW